jgi:hypothetical protein
MCKILVSCEISGVQRNLAKHDSEIIRVVCCMGGGVSHAIAWLDTIISFP